MLGWAIGFLLAAVAAGLFAFGVLDNPVGGVATDLFWACIGLFGAALLFAVLGGKYATPFRDSGRSFARLAFVAVAGLLGYVWVDRNWSTEPAAVVVDAEEAAADAAPPTEPAPDAAGLTALGDAEDAAGSYGAETEQPPPAQ